MEVEGSRCWPVDMFVLGALQDSLGSIHGGDLLIRIQEYYNSSTMTVLDSIRHAEELQ